jgi:hypothetical protein
VALFHLRHESSDERYFIIATALFSIHSLEDGDEAFQGGAWLRRIIL